MEKDRYVRVCMDPSAPNDKKYQAFIKLNEKYPLDSIELLVRLRDMVPHIKNIDLKTKHINLLVSISKYEKLVDHEKSMIATCLYNNSILDECYDCYIYLAKSNIQIEYKIDACTYLFGSEIDENRLIAQEELMKIIKNKKYSDELRYNSLAKFMSKSGIVTYTNSIRINIPYDEDFIRDLQYEFFFDKENAIRYRIFSGQHLLSMNSERNEEVTKELFSIAENITYDENTRADAADVLLRLSNEKTRARNIIVSMGYSTVSKRNKDFMKKIQTVYNNSQNVHDEKIGTAVNKFIEEFLSNNNDYDLIDFETVKTQINAMIKTKKIDVKKKNIVQKILNQIGINTAAFTKHNVTLSEILTHVWLRVKQYNKDDLYDRVIEELLDMEDTCSSGHAARCVNILSTVDRALNIDFEEQIKTNLLGRINARIRDLKDKNIADSIALGFMEDATQEEREICKKELNTIIDDIKKELRTEFVDGNYITGDQFEEYFTRSKSTWMDHLN